MADQPPDPHQALNENQPPLPPEVLSLPTEEHQGRPLVRYDHVAALLGVKPDTLRQMRRDGKLGQPARHVGKTPFYDLRTVADAWQVREAKPEALTPQRITEGVIAGTLRPILSAIEGASISRDKLTENFHGQLLEHLKDRERVDLEELRESREKIVTLTAENATLRAEVERLRRELEEALKPFWRKSRKS